jgi:16S rRNA (uracil1498-N3)-methyltransferase
LIPRLFVSNDQIRGKTALIEGSDVNYLKNVMRLKVGDEITVVDTKSREFSSKITSLDKDSVTAEFYFEKHPMSEPKIQFTLAQGLPRSQKMDMIVQKATELGVYRIIPLVTERSIVKLDEERADSKVERWGKIAKEAAEQSGRLLIPMIDTPKGIKDILSMKTEFDAFIVLWEMEKETSLKTFLRNKPTSGNVLMVIGPEGGLSLSEVDSMKKAGFTTVTIGSRILRTETAAIAVLSMISYELDL